MTSSNGNIFRVAGPLCGDFTGPGEFPTQRPVTRSFDVFFDLRPNKRLSKQSWGWWFETLSRSLWRHCNGVVPLLEHRRYASPALTHRYFAYTPLNAFSRKEAPLCLHHWIQLILQTIWWAVSIFVNAVQTILSRFNISLTSTHLSVNNVSLKYVNILQILALIFTVCELRFTYITPGHSLSTPTWLRHRVCCWSHDTK